MIRFLRIIAGIVLFVPIWVSMYLYRIIWGDIIESIIESIMDLVMLNPLAAIGNLLWSILCLPLDIVIGLFVTFAVAISQSMEIAFN